MKLEINATCLKHEFYQDGEEVFTHRKCVNSN
jgi:hypothetical protein